MRTSSYHSLFVARVVCVCLLKEIFYGLHFHMLYLVVFACFVLWVNMFEVGSVACSLRVVQYSNEGLHLARRDGSTPPVNSNSLNLLISTHFLVIK